VERKKQVETFEKSEVRCWTSWKDSWEKESEKRFSQEGQERDLPRKRSQSSLIEFRNG